MSARKGRPPDRERAGAGATPAPTPNTSRHQEADNSKLSGPGPESNRRAPDGFIGDGDDQLGHEWAGQGFRRTFATPRAAEFLERRGLQAQTGQPVDQFAAVIFKELIDNALDAAESAGSDPQLHISTGLDNETLTVTVADNGSGIPPHVVERVLDFGVLVSDKAAYRSPTRGLQGNALKTVLGIPTALAVTTPVVIEACGIRHEVTLSLDPARHVVVGYKQTSCDRVVGTAVRVTLPDWLRLDPARWVKATALVNPHATIELADTSAPGLTDFYKPSVGEDWRKPLPTDPLQVHWFDEPALTRLVYEHVGVARGGGRDLPLGEFLSGFAGLSSSAKRKEITAAVPGIAYLSDFERLPDRVPLLLAAMRKASRAPKPTKLGSVPGEHYRACFEAWYGATRWWFRRASLVDDAGMPWVIEAGVADTEVRAEAFWAVNYSPSFGDPLGRTFISHDELSGAGSPSMLGDAFPGSANNGYRAVVLHLISPAVEFIDKGKVALEVPPVVAEAAAGVLASVGKVVRTEQKRRERDARKEDRRRSEQIARSTTSAPSLKNAVFMVTPEAFEKARGPGKLPVSNRTLLYQVRPLVQKLGVTHDLSQNYFRSRGSLISRSTLADRA